MAVFGPHPAQADGNFTSPFGTSGTGNALLQVQSNRARLISTTQRDAIATHGITTTGNWKISAWIIATDVVGEGGVSWTMINAGGDGWGIFIGNAVHIRKYTAGVSGGNLTNNARTNTGNVFAEWTNNESSGLREVRLDSVLTSFHTDAAFDGGTSFLPFIDNQAYPNPINQWWELRIEDNNTVTGPPAALSRPNQIRSQAVRRASVW